MPAAANSPATTTSNTSSEVDYIFLDADIDSYNNVTTMMLQHYVGLCRDAKDRGADI